MSEFDTLFDEEEPKKIVKKEKEEKEKEFECEICGKKYSTESWLQRHIEDKHKPKEPKKVEVDLTEITNELKSIKKMLGNINLTEVQEDGEDPFGIRFYSWMARQLKIKNYGSIPIKQLMLVIGKALIKESGLVDFKKILNNIKKDK